MRRPGCRGPIIGIAGRAIQPIPAVWAELVRTLAPAERVHILAGGEGVLAKRGKWWRQVPNVEIHDIPTNDAWMRDHGPMFLLAAPAAPALVHWGYNAWGGKYPPFDRDVAGAAPGGGVARHAPL